MRLHLNDIGRACARHLCLKIVMGWCHTMQYAQGNFKKYEIWMPVFTSLQMVYPRIYYMEQIRRTCASIEWNESFGPLCLHFLHWIKKQGMIPVSFDVIQRIWPGFRTHFHTNLDPCACEGCLCDWFLCTTSYYVVWVWSQPHTVSNILREGMKCIITNPQGLWPIDKWISGQLGHTHATIVALNGHTLLHLFH